MRLHKQNKINFYFSFLPNIWSRYDDQVVVVNIDFSVSGCHKRMLQVIILSGHANTERRWTAARSWTIVDQCGVCKTNVQEKKSTTFYSVSLRLLTESGKFTTE